MRFCQGERTRIGIQVSAHIIYTSVCTSIKARTAVTSGWEEKKPHTFSCFLPARPTFCNMTEERLGNKNNTGESYFIKKEKPWSLGSSLDAGLQHLYFIRQAWSYGRHEEGTGLQAESQYFKRVQSIKMLEIIKNLESRWSGPKRERQR